MAFFTGRSGRLVFNPLIQDWDRTGDPNFGFGEAALKLRDWSLETSLELLETTTLDTAVKSYTPGTVTATGSATLLYYRAEPGDVGRQFTQLLDKIMKKGFDGVNESDRFLMGLVAGTTPGVAGGPNDRKDDIVFLGYITNASIQVSTGELTSVSINFTVDGPFIETIDA